MRHAVFLLGQRCGGGWRFLHERDRPSGLRIAMSATQNIPYPLYGSRFRNAVFFVPRDGRTQSLYYGLASGDLEPFRNVSEAEWRVAMRRLRPDYFFSAVGMDSGRFGVEGAWATADAGHFSLVYGDPAVRIYEVRGGEGRSD